MREYQYKILVVGDLGTGKTSLLKRLVYNTFSSNYKSTIGVDFALKVFQLESDMIVSLQLWDIAGQERFGSMTRAYYKGAIGAFIVYDVTRPPTFENVMKWKNDIDSKVRLPSIWGEDPLPTVLLANKIDQQANLKSETEMNEFCSENGFINWFETSAKENTNIIDAARCLINYIVQLETSKSSDSEYELDYRSDTTTISLDNNNNNKIESSNRCCA